MAVKGNVRTPDISTFEDAGVARRTLDEKLDRREEPTRAALREAVVEAFRGQFSRKEPFV